jgi:hypothetical protein
MRRTMLFVYCGQQNILVWTFLYSNSISWSYLDSQSISGLKLQLSGYLFAVVLIAKLRYLFPQSAPGSAKG